MGLESATWVTQFDATFPQSSDPRSQGDDHLRLVKSVLQTELGVANRQWVYTAESAIWASSTSLKIDGDKTTAYQAGRRVKVVGNTTGTLYGSVASSTYSASTTIHFRFDSGSMSNEKITPYLSGLTVSNSAIPFTSRNVLEFGAVGDGVTDSTTAIQNAINYVEAQGGGVVMFPAGSFVTSAPLTIDTAGVVLQGAGGHLGQTTITCSNTADGVVRIKARSCGVRGMRLDSDATRYAAAATDGHGIHYEGDDTAGLSMSRGNFYDLDIRRQPLDGIHIASGFEHGLIDLVTVSDCKRHGLAMDDGTRSGRTNKDLGPFMFQVKRFRAFECGGNAILAGASGQTTATQQGYFEQVEALGCCWNSSTRESLYQIESYCQGAIFISPDLEDQQYAATTTTTTSSTRTGNATPAKGFRFNSGRGYVLNGYFSSLLSSVETGGNLDDLVVEYPRIFAGTYAVAQAAAIIIATTDDGVFIKASTAATTGATLIVQNQSDTAEIVIDGDRRKGVAWTAGDFSINSNGVERTISSGTLEAQEDLVFVKGEGDTTDSFATLRLASGVNGFNGLVMRIINRNAYTITVTHTTGNIELRAGSSLALGQLQGVTLAYSETGASWVEV